MAWRRIQGQVSWWHPTDRMNDYKSLSSFAGRSNRLVTVSGSATRDNPGESAAAPARAARVRPRISALCLSRVASLKSQVPEGATVAGALEVALSVSRLGNSPGL